MSEAIQTTSQDEKLKLHEAEGCLLVISQAGFPPLVRLKPDEAKALIEEIARLRKLVDELGGCLNTTMIYCFPDKIPHSQVRHNITALVNAGYNGDGVDGKGN